MFLVIPSCLLSVRVRLAELFQNTLNVTGKIIEMFFIKSSTIINYLIYLGILTKSRQSTTNCLDLKTLDKEISGDDVLYVCGRPFFKFVGTVGQLWRRCFR